METLGKFRVETLDSSFRPLYLFDTEKDALILTMKDLVASLCFLQSYYSVVFCFVLEHTIKAHRTGDRLFICPTHIFFFKLNTCYSPGPGEVHGGNKIGLTVCGVEIFTQQL